jgi:hypothetical protein
VSWSLRFAEPIVLPNGAKLATLRQAIAHLVNTIPPGERSLPAVLTAAELLTNAAEHSGPVEFARIAPCRRLIVTPSASSIPIAKGHIGDGAN